MKLGIFGKSPEEMSSTSGVITDGYIAYDHPFEGDPADSSRQNARESFNHFIEHKNEQVLRLKRLLSKNGLKLTGDSNDIRAINKWINESACLDEDDFFVDDDGERRHYIHPDWSNIIFDLAIFVSELVIQNTDNVSWTFNVNVPSHEVSYQHPVLTGFSKVNSKGYYQNFGLTLFNYVQEITDDKDNASDDFINFIIEDAILEDVDLDVTMFDHTDFGEQVSMN